MRSLKYVIIVSLSLLCLCPGLKKGHPQASFYKLTGDSSRESLKYSLAFDSYIKMSGDSVSVNVFSRAATAAAHRFYVTAQQVIPSAFNRETDLMKSCTFRYTPIQTQMFNDELYQRMMIRNPQMMIDRGTGSHWRPAMINVIGF